MVGYKLLQRDQPSFYASPESIVFIFRSRLDCCSLSWDSFAWRPRENRNADQNRSINDTSAVNWAALNFSGQYQNVWYVSIPRRPGLVSDVSFLVNLSGVSLTL